jgi:hypothetical protein
MNPLEIADVCAKPKNLRALTSNEIIAKTIQIN